MNYKKLGAMVQEESEEVVNKIIKDIHKGDIKGRENEITAQLRCEINNHLLENIKRKLDKKIINGVKFEVYIYKDKSEEPSTGADLGGLVEIELKGKKISKAYLAQAKVCKIENMGDSGCPIIKCKDRNIEDQANKMTSITSESFFFLYTQQGIYVVPAMEVNLIAKNSINTEDFAPLNFGEFYENIFKCFIGDHKIAPFYKDIETLVAFAKDYKVKNVLYIKAAIKNES